MRPGHARRWRPLRRGTPPVAEGALVVGAVGFSVRQSPERSGSASVSRRRISIAFHVKAASLVTISECTKHISLVNAITVEFGLRLDGEAGAVFAKAGIGAHFTITLNWSRADQTPTPAKPTVARTPNARPTLGSDLGRCEEPSASRSGAPSRHLCADQLPDSVQPGDPVATSALVQVRLRGRSDPGSAA